MLVQQTRTPTPTDVEHVKILIARNFRTDMKKPKLWLAKFILIVPILMFYTIGVFLSYDGADDTSTIDGNFRFFAEEYWSFPAKMNFAGTNNSFVDQVISTIDAQQVSEIRLQNFNTDNMTDFKLLCAEIAGTAYDEVCVFVDSIYSYRIFFGGKEFATPFQPSLAATQWAVNSALLYVAKGDEVYPVDKIQRSPQMVQDKTGKTDAATVLVPAIMHVLSAVGMTVFLMGPVSYEKINEVSRSFQLVGVKLRTYILQWFLYYGLNGIITAVLLTCVSIFWRVFPMSNFIYIFLSHFFSLLHLYASFILLMQMIPQEELAQSIPWMIGFASIAVGASLLISNSPDFILLTILSAISPFIGMIQYYGIYITYDKPGVATGVQGDNFVSSGLLGNMIAQIVGILLWVGLSVFFSSPYVERWMENRYSRMSGNDTHATQGDNFEPLSKGSEVLMSVRGVHHTYHPPPLSCGKDAKRVEVLKGLDMDICRGEVFGYLGHNGAGKSTSLSILASELCLQEGNVKYHFCRGDVSLGDRGSQEVVRNNVGVCPQHNTALQDTLTCRETLRLFAHLKGGITMEAGQTVSAAVEAEVERRLADVKFTSEEDADKPVGTYSGGMKRKVLIAMALLGDPEIVFLDEPTAGLDPYNRQVIWDMITAAKEGRSIILTSHYLDEVDVLSDRIGILKNGKLITCGTSLFLKHHFGVGYTLSFEAPAVIDIASLIPGATRIEKETTSTFEWQLEHGSESLFSDALLALSERGAVNVNLELTTLEQVFLETGKEDAQDDETSEEAEDNGNNARNPNEDMEDTRSKAENLSKIWKPMDNVRILPKWQRFLLVQSFMMNHALKIGGVILINISMPLAYLVGGMVMTTLIEVPNKGDTILHDPIQLNPNLAGTETMQFFGIPTLEDVNPIEPLVAADAPRTVQDYFIDETPPFIGGYFQANSTLQYAPEHSQFALQIGALVLSNNQNSFLSGIATSVQQLPYITDAPFRLDLIALPLCMALGFAGVAFSLLDVLILKGRNIIALFRVSGINEWMTYGGVVMYKFNTTFVPFFILTIILGVSLQTVLFGNGGRWLGTILMMFAYAYSNSPLGLILAKRFIHSEFKSVATWFPGVYFTFVGWPYIAWVSALQALPDAQRTILIFGDVLCLIPQVAFQRGIGAVVFVSSVYDDPELSWSDVWRFETRILFTIIMMLVVGTLEWLYLYRLTTTREPQTKLSAEESELATPLNVSHDPDISAERARSMKDDQGINTRDLVKVFRVKPDKDSKYKKEVLKRGVKGVSYGIRTNEIYALLGPNGAGKTVTMSMLAGQYAPEHGEIGLNGLKAEESDRSIDHLYESCKVAYCPQFDALFPMKTVEEHLQFYAKIRGLGWNQDSTREHIAAITKLLGLSKHKAKQANQLSGGYKRRLSLGVALIGYPKLIMADEPSTGLDPAARRLVWDVLKPGSNREGYDVPAILLSSHYMEECEKLGSRIGIMVDGALSVTASLARLRTLYCTSYVVEISLLLTAGDDAEDRIVQIFKMENMPCEVYESLPYRFKLKVKVDEGVQDDNSKQLSEIFRLLESRKQSLGIKFYSVAMMNLEQIFIDLSRKQFEADDDFNTQRVRG